VGTRICLLKCLPCINKFLSIDPNFFNDTYIIIADIFFYVVIYKQIPLTAVTSVIDGLKKLYIEKLKPLEVTYKFNDFVSPFLVYTYIPSF